MMAGSLRWSLALAALLAAGAASAAERALPPGGPAADCAPGFAAVPGTRTCVKVGGRVRAEMATGPGGARSVAGGRVTLDARTQTDHGPLRTFLQVGTGSGR